MNEKAQTAFETITIVSIIMVFSFVALGMVPRFAKSLEEIAVFRIETLEALSRDWNGLYIISGIADPKVENSKLTLEVYSSGDFWNENIKLRVEKKEVKIGKVCKFPDVNIVVS